MYLLEFPRLPCFSLSLRIGRGRTIWQFFFNHPMPAWAVYWPPNTARPVLRATDSWRLSQMPTDVLTLSCGRWRLQPARTSLWVFASSQWYLSLLSFWSTWRPPDFQCCLLAGTELQSSSPILLNFSHFVPPLPSLRPWRSCGHPDLSKPRNSLAHSSGSLAAMFGPPAPTRILWDFLWRIWFVWSSPFGGFLPNKVHVVCVSNMLSEVTFSGFFVRLLLVLAFREFNLLLQGSSGGCFFVRRSLSACSDRGRHFISLLPSISI